MLLAIPGLVLIGEPGYVMIVAADVFLELYVWSLWPTYVALALDAVRKNKLSFDWLPCALLCFALDTTE